MMHLWSRMNMQTPSSVTLMVQQPEASNPRPLEQGLLALALLTMYVPTYIALDKTIWNIVGQGHGPVMLMLALWLGYQRWPALLSLHAQSEKLFGVVFLLLGSMAYVVGRSQDVLFLDAFSQIPIIGGLILMYRGWAGLRVMWFPLFFVLFIVPIPGSIVDQITGPLKHAVSVVAESILYHVGYPVARSGVTLTIGSYQLLVADACAGLNSIFALEAIGVFYMSVVQHKNKMRNIILAILIVPISFVSNVIRVISLVLITYYFGDEVGQGFVHNFAGILLFMAATSLTIGVDAILGLFMKQSTSALSERSK